ncbi:MAG: hypothetical protein NWP49_07715, partial [Litorivicinaceae bacterium]|nr:hypothetical protein [Litorivicinaceae bacterium]
MATLKPLLEDLSILKIGQNIKYDWQMLKKHGIHMTPCDDTMLMSYVLDAGVNGHGMDELSRKYLGHEPIPFSEVAGKGKTFIGFARVEIDTATAYSAEDADVTLRLWQILKPRLAAERMTAVYETLERPMVDVLARMEQRGIAILLTLILVIFTLIAIGLIICGTVGMDFIRQKGGSEDDLSRDA